MDKDRIKTLGDLLLKAEQARQPIDPITETDPGVTVDDAYQIQLRVMELKQKAGQVVVGKKIGLTSLAMQTMLGVSEPDYGHILHGMVIMEGSKIPAGDLIAPRIEGEIAFVLKEDLQGPGVTVADVLRCTEGVVPALEIVDSRIRNWKIKLADTVADNASSALIVLGGILSPLQGLDLRTVGMVMEKNGEVQGTATGAAVLGHPAQAVAWLANKLSAYGIILRKGEVVLSGALTAALPLVAGDFFCANFGPMGEVKIKFS